MPYDPGDDVIVIHQPREGAASGTFRAFAATLKGLKTTFARVPEGTITINYP